MLAAKVRELHRRYTAARVDPTAKEHTWAGFLRYYQYLARAVMCDPEFGLGADGNARGLLVYHPPGFGKTRLAAAVAMTLWDTRPPVVLLARGLQRNFRETVAAFVAALHPGEAPETIARLQAAALARIRFVSLDAFNAADQMVREGSLDGRLLIVDEAHNFFRAVINSPAEGANARRIYEQIMAARDLRIVFLTGTPAAKDPFELVPCFNMLAGWDLLPAQYETFCELYVDRASRRVRNRGKLANRLVGLVSHVSFAAPGVLAAEPPCASAACPRSGAEATPAAGPRPRDDGWLPEEKPTRTERVPMGVAQYRQYLLAREKEEQEGKGGEGGPGGEGAGRPPPALALPGSEKKAMRSYFVKSRTLSDFCPPRGWEGRSVDAMPDEAFTPENGPKLALIAERVDKAPGPVLVYSQFVERGLKALGRYLQRLGYAPFRPEIARAQPRAPRAREGSASAEAGPEAGPEAEVRGGGDTFSVDGRRFYSVPKTWALMAADGAPIESVEVARLAFMLDEPRWGATRAEVSARDVLANPLAHPDHVRRIQEADLGWPILVVTTPLRHGVDFTIADGMHRLARAVRDGLPTIRVRRVPPQVLEAAFEFEEDGDEAPHPARLEPRAASCGQGAPAPGGGDPHPARFGAGTPRRQTRAARRRAPRPPAARDPFAGLATEPNPPLVVDTYRSGPRTLRVVRDDLLVAGTKQRVAADFVRGLLYGRPEVRTLLYTAPFDGFGPVAAAYAARRLGLASLLLLSRRPVGAELGAPPAPEAEAAGAETVRRARALGAEVRFFPGWGPLVAAGQEAARDPAVLWLPLGFHAEGFSEALAARLRAAAGPGFAPGRIWVAAGTGAVGRALALAFPAARVTMVPSTLDAKKLGKLGAVAEVTPGLDLLRAHAPPRVAPYPTVAGYDARAWDAAVALGGEGDVVWNVAGVAARPAAARERTGGGHRLQRAATAARRRARAARLAAAGAGARRADRARASSREVAADFPWRALYMPPPAEMFGRLRAIARDPPAAWLEADPKAKAVPPPGRIGMVLRTFPGDYEATDSMTDHWAERVRVACRERGEPSPSEVWARLRRGPGLPADARARRELVYAEARGCNLFNDALATHLLARFGARRVCDCTAGWGDRLAAAHAAGARLYRGWDTNPDLQPVYAAIGAALGPLLDAPLDWAVALAPFESAAARFAPGGDLAAAFDAVLFCPPFFDKEVYQGPGTSTDTGPTEEAWYARFYRPALRAAGRAAEPGGRVLAYVAPGRMREEAARVLEGDGLEYEGAIGFRQVVAWGGPTPGPVRDTFVWRRAPPRPQAEPAPATAAAAAPGPPGKGPAARRSLAAGPAPVAAGEPEPTARRAIEVELAATELTRALVDSGLPPVPGPQGARARREGRSAIERWILTAANGTDLPSGEGAGAGAAGAPPRAWVVHRALLGAGTAAAKLAAELSSLGVGFDGEAVAAALADRVRAATQVDPPPRPGLVVSLGPEAVAVSWAGPPPGSARLALAGQGERLAAHLAQRGSDQRAAAAAVARVALRYAAAACGGQQLGLPRAHYEALYAAGVRNEAFASPLNSRLLPLGRDDTRFCSLYPDTDAPFGSLGSFFAADVEGAPGGWTVNPPYVEALMERAWARVGAALDAWAASGAAAAAPQLRPKPVFVLLPAWDDNATVRAVTGSPHRLHVERLEPNTYELETPGGRRFAAPFACYYAVLWPGGGKTVPSEECGRLRALCRSVRLTPQPSRLREPAGGAKARKAVTARTAAAATTVSATATATGGDARSGAPRGYYAIISGEVPQEARDAIKAACNSQANARGAVIKALLVSKTGAEGLDLRWLRETHQVEPYWDRARDDQVRKRAVRMGSHDGLPREDRDVQPYLYVATANEGVWQAMLERDREAKTVDETFHERATERYELNEDFRRLLSEVSLECEFFGFGNCRQCVPTGAPLFHADPALDARLPDPCEPRRTSEVHATPLEVSGSTYYYAPDPTAPGGYAFYAYREELGGHAPVDPSDPIVSALLRALGRPGPTAG